MCVRILPLPLRGPTTDIQYNAGPTLISQDAIEGSGKHVCIINLTPFFLIFREDSEKYPIPRQIDLKTTLIQVFLG